MMNNTKTTSRRLRIDSFRVYAMFLIVCLHVYLLANPCPTKFLENMGKLSFGIGARYAVPFFFCLAGYFTGGKILREPQKSLAIVGKYTARLLSIFLFWELVYILEQPQAFLQLVREDPIRFAFEGSRVHLWFLVSLILTVWLFVLWPARKSYKSFLLLGGAFYVVGLLGGAYRTTPIGIDIHFDTRNAVFFSTLFFAIGIMLSDKLPTMSKRTALGIAIGGLVLSILESYFFRKVIDISPAWLDYILCTVPFSVGMVLLCLTQPDTQLDKFIAPLGKYTLGVYASHMLFIDLLEPITRLIHSFFGQLVWFAAFPILVFILALLTSILLAKTPLRRVVQ